MIPTAHRRRINYIAPYSVPDPAADLPDPEDNMPAPSAQRLRQRPIPMPAARSAHTQVDGLARTRVAWASAKAAC